MLKLNLFSGYVACLVLLTGIYAENTTLVSMEKLRKSVEQTSSAKNRLDYRNYETTQGIIDAGEVVVIENKKDITLADADMSIVDNSQLNIINSQGEIHGTLSIGGFNAGGNKVRVIGVNEPSRDEYSSLNIDGDLNIGLDSNNNMLLIQGVGYSSWDTNFHFQDISALMNLYGNVSIGSEDGGYGNSIVLRNGAHILSYSDSPEQTSFELHNGSLLDIGAGCSVGALNYYQSADSILRLGLSETSGFRLFVNYELNFEKGTTVSFYEVGSVTESVTDMVLIASDRWFVVDNNGNTIVTDSEYSSFLANANIVIENINILSSLLDVELKVTDGENFFISIVADITRIPLATCSGLVDTSLGEVADEIDAMAAVDGSNAALMIDEFNLMTGDEQREQLETMYEEELPVANTQIQAMHDFSRVLHYRTRKNGQGIEVIESDGLASSITTKKEWQTWMKAFGSITDVDSYDGHEGYDFDNYGTVIGLDKTEDTLTYGLAFGITQSDLESGNGNSANADSYYGAFYGSYDGDDWFVDLSLSYDYADIDARSGSVFDITADYSAHIFSFYLGTGKEFGLTDSLFIVPEISLQTTYYDQESYREDSADAVGKDVDGYDRWSYLSTVGVTLELRELFKNSSVTPEFHVFWEHEFNTDEDDVSYALIGGTTGSSFELQAPVADVVRLGFGISADVAKNVKLSAGYDIRLGNNYTSQSANAKLIYSF